MLMGGYFDLIFNEMVQGIFNGLGLTKELALFVGLAKILGVVGIFQMYSKEIRLWAHVGFVFLFVGAVFLHIAAGQPFTMSIPAIAMLTLASGSYFLAKKLKRI